MNRIESLHLTRSEYGINKGKLAGNLSVENTYGKMEIPIDPEKALAILAILAPALVATAQQTAHLMTDEITEQAKAGPALIEQDA